MARSCLVQRRLTWRRGSSAFKQAEGWDADFARSRRRRSHPDGASPRYFRDAGAKLRTFCSIGMFGMGKILHRHLRRRPLSPLLILWAFVLSTPVQAGTQRPNIVVILADDLGYGDVSFTGTLSDYTTTNIDSIAANGVRCTNVYATHPVCSPSRAGLITVRYQQRFGYENNSDTNSSTPRQGVPMAEVLPPQ